MGNAGVARDYYGILGVGRDAGLAVVPGTSHVLILEKPEFVARLVLDFLTTDPVPTRVPIRRR